MQAELIRTPIYTEKFMKGQWDRPDTLPARKIKQMTHRESVNKGQI